MVFREPNAAISACIGHCTWLACTRCNRADVALINTAVAVVIDAVADLDDIAEKSTFAVGGNRDEVSSDGSHPMVAATPCASTRP